MPLNDEGKLGCSGCVSNSCSTSNNRRVTVERHENHHVYIHITHTLRTTKILYRIKMFCQIVGIPMGTDCVTISLPIFMLSFIIVIVCGLFFLMEANLCRLVFFIVCMELSRRMNWDPINLLNLAILLGELLEFPSV